MAVAHAGDDMGLVGFDLHPAAAAEALLAAPEFAVNAPLVDWHSRRHAREGRDERLAMRLACCDETQHPGERRGQTGKFLL